MAQVGTGEATRNHSRPTVFAQAGHFVAHLGEMILAMMIGMMLSGAVLAVAFSTLLASTISGMTQREVFNEFAVLICLVVATGMTSTMVAWMRYRGMQWRPVLEMGAAMIVPLVPIFGLLGLHVIPGASACGFYCAAMIPAMVFVMLFRADLYTGRAGPHGHGVHAAQGA
jgi:hypothetical protein